jgi:hypothetical protein
MELAKKSSAEMKPAEILRETLKVLGGIWVPMGMKREIADPIGGAIGNIEVCIRMLEGEKNDGKADAE